MRTKFPKQNVIAKILKIRPKIPVKILIKNMVERKRNEIVVGMTSEKVSVHLVNQSRKFKGEMFGGFELAHVHTCCFIFQKILRLQQCLNE